MTTSSPAYRGYLSDVDCRWGVLENSIDDRTREETGLEVIRVGIIFVDDTTEQRLIT